MEKVVGEQGLAVQQHFPHKSSKFSENSNCREKLNSRGLKPGHFGIFDALFPFLAIFSYKGPILDSPGISDAC